MPLSDDEYHRLSAMLMSLSFVKHRLTRTELSFITDISERFETNGADMNMSRRQWNWLLSIYSRCA